uniref:hypothetical protein n=2 Tax=Gemmiger formicilis TaxID=745368 RepID=UPI003FF13A5E
KIKKNKNKKTPGGGQKSRGGLFVRGAASSTPRGGVKTPPYNAIQKGCCRGEHCSHAAHGGGHNASGAMTSIAPYTVGADSISARSVRRIAAKILAYRRNFCYNTKAACFTTDGKALHTTAGGWPHFRKGGETMRFTFTFYIGRKTFTLSLVVKSNNRHPGR